MSGAEEHGLATTRPPLSAGAGALVAEFEATVGGLVRQRLFGTWAETGARNELTVDQAQKALDQVRRELAADQPEQPTAGPLLRQQVGVALLGVAGAFLLALLAAERTWIAMGAVACAIAAALCLVPRRSDSST